MTPYLRLPWKVVHSQFSLFPAWWASLSVTVAKSRLLVEKRPFRNKVALGLDYCWLWHILELPATEDQFPWELGSTVDLLKEVGVRTLTTILVISQHAMQFSLPCSSSKGFVTCSLPTKVSWNEQPLSFFGIEWLWRESKTVREIDTRRSPV